MMFMARSGDSLAGSLTYRRSEHGFHFQVMSPGDAEERLARGGRASLAAGTLQLEISVDSGELLFPWGYHPMGPWRQARLDGPAWTSGRVFVSFDDEIEESVSIAIPAAQWHTDFDRSSGWVRVSDVADENENVVKVADGFGIGLVEGKLSSIWLNPIFES